MNDSARKVATLATKDFLDLFKNPGVAVCLVLPLGLSAMLALTMPAEAFETPQGTDVVLGTMLTGALTMSIAMVGSMAILYSLAEEKEKHTLRTLILSNVSAGQIMAAKALVGVVGIVLVQAACFAVLKAMLPVLPLSLLPPYLGLGLLGALTVVLPSLVLGLASRDQMTASLYSMPVVLLALAPMFGMYSDDIARVVRLFPTGGVCSVMDMVVNGTLTLQAAMLPLAVTFAWIAAGAVAFRLLYRRLAYDN